MLTFRAVLCYGLKAKISQTEIKKENKAISHNNVVVLLQFFVSTLCMLQFSIRK